MITKIIASFLLCLICLLSTAGTPAQQTLNANELAGTYISMAQFSSSAITLDSNGNYYDDSTSCTFTTAESGTYVFSDGILRFTIVKYTGKHNGDETEVDLFEPQGRKEIFGYSGDEKVEPLKTKFSLIPVKWDGRIYLIQDDDLQSFSNAINLGLEPRSTLHSEPYYGAFYIRQGDEKKSVSGKPSLPAEWQSFLLSSPVTVEIIAIEKQGEYQVATINSGSEDGLKVGMKLITEDQKPAPWSDIGSVLSVEEKTAKVKVYDLKVGDSLSTRYVPKDIYR